jgi:hypothetical protein
MKKEKKMTPYLFLLCLLSCSSGMTKTAITLPGKILTFKSQKNAYLCYENSDTAKMFFKSRDNKDTNYHLNTWLNTKDTFVGDEYIIKSNRINDKCNIVAFDLSGKITDRIYEAETGEIARACYPSRDDKYLIFTSERNLDPEIYPLEGLNPMVALGIINLEQKEVIIKIDSFGRLPNLKIEESPWLQEDGHRFVYSIDGATQFILQGEARPINPIETVVGVYVFDVATGKGSLLIPGGFSAIASPTNNSIAYEVNNCVMVMDLRNKKERIIYTSRTKQSLISIGLRMESLFTFLIFRAHL